MSKIKKDGKSFWERHSASIIAIVALSFVVIVWLITRYSLAADPSRGTFGDMFGGANALFSGLAFVGLIYAILLQRQELSLQRQELKATREELKGQKEEQEKQTKFIAQQTFENTFFQMLRFLNDLVESIDLYREGTTNFSAKTTKGKDCFESFQKRLNKQLKKHDTEKNSLELITLEYNNFYKKNKQNLGHYYRTLYNIVKLIDKAPIPKENKRLYANIVRAQLSDSEIYVLFYNCLTPVGKKFKPLVEKYALLKMINQDELLDKNDMNLYNEKAFGETP